MTTKKTSAARDVLELVAKEVECYCCDVGVSDKSPCAVCRATALLNGLQDFGGELVKPSKGNRMSISVRLKNHAGDVEASANLLDIEKPGNPVHLGKFTVDIRGWLTLKKVFMALSHPAKLSFTGDSVVDARARRAEVERG